MILVPIDMPESCKSCPLAEGGMLRFCQIMPHVPYMVDVTKYAETRSPYCELKEYHEKENAIKHLKVPEKCRDCEESSINQNDQNKEQEGQ